MVAMSELLKPSDAVYEALRSGQPVLALESTIITHGLPFPFNLETAQAAEQAVRDAGATPATIAVVDGRLKLGLGGYELERLAELGDKATKCSRRDLPFMIERRATAGTTVAATMIIAHLAGIAVFATGGIGGVHQGGASSMDISADLQELARTNVAVVCAGPKSILDIGLTREYLETHGVPVVGYQTDRLPAFYARKSGYEVDYRADSAAEIARLVDTKWSMGLNGGLVIANPIPREAALNRKTVAQINETAIREAEDQKIEGNLLTPFLLNRVKDLTEGKSLAANRALMINNARLGAEIAIALSP